MAPGTAGIEYDTIAPAQGVVVPVMALGAAGADNGVMVRHDGEPEPQLLLAVTQISPDAEPIVTEIEVVF